MRPTAVLRGDLVTLDALTYADASALAHWRSDPDFTRMLDARPWLPVSTPDMRQWIRRGNDASDCHPFAIRENREHRIVGHCEVDGVIPSHGTASFSIAIGDPADRGRGYGREALNLLLGFAFHDLKLHRVGLTVFEYNGIAIRLYDSMGFRREGAHREFLLHDGRRYDMLLYGMLRREWEARAGTGR